MAGRLPEPQPLAECAGDTAGYRVECRAGRVNRADQECGRTRGMDGADEGY